MVPRCIDMIGKVLFRYDTHNWNTHIHNRMYFCRIILFHLSHRQCTRKDTHVVLVHMCFTIMTTFKQQNHFLYFWLKEARMEMKPGTHAYYIILMTTCLRKQQSTSHTFLRIILKTC